MPEREQHAPREIWRRSQAPPAWFVPHPPDGTGYDHHHSHSPTTAAPAPAFQSHSAASLPSVGNAPSPMRCATHRTAAHRLTILSRSWFWRAWAATSCFRLTRLLTIVCDSRHSGAAARVASSDRRHEAHPLVAGRRPVPVSAGPVYFRTTPQARPHSRPR